MTTESKPIYDYLESTVMNISNIVNLVAKTVAYWKSNVNQVHIAGIEFLTQSGGLPTVLAPKVPIGDPKVADHMKEYLTLTKTLSNHIGKRIVDNITRFAFPSITSSILPALANDVAILTGIVVELQKVKETMKMLSKVVSEIRLQSGITTAQASVALGKDVVDATIEQLIIWCNPSTPPPEQIKVPYNQYYIGFLAALRQLNKDVGLGGNKFELECVKLNREMRDPTKDKVAALTAFQTEYRKPAVLGSPSMGAAGNTNATFVATLGNIHTLLKAAAPNNTNIPFLKLTFQSVDSSKLLNARKFLEKKNFNARSLLSGNGIRPVDASLAKAAAIQDINNMLAPNNQSYTANLFGGTFRLDINPNAIQLSGIDTSNTNPNMFVSKTAETNAVKVDNLLNTYGRLAKFFGNGCDDEDYSYYNASGSNKRSRPSGISNFNKKIRSTNNSTNSFGSSALADKLIESADAVKSSLSTANMFFNDLPTIITKLEGSGVINIKDITPENPDFLAYLNSPIKKCEPNFVNNLIAHGRPIQKYLQACGIVKDTINKQKLFGGAPSAQPTAVALNQEPGKYKAADTHQVYLNFAAQINNQIELILSNLRQESDVLVPKLAELFQINVINMITSSEIALGSFKSFTTINQSDINLVDFSIQSVLAAGTNTSNPNYALINPYVPMFKKLSSFCQELSVLLEKEPILSKRFLVTDLLPQELLTQWILAVAVANPDSPFMVTSSANLVKINDYEQPGEFSGIVFKKDAADQSSLIIDEPSAFVENGSVNTSFFTEIESIIQKGIDSDAVVETQLTSLDDDIFNLCETYDKELGLAISCTPLPTLFDFASKLPSLIPTQSFPIEFNIDFPVGQTEVRGFSLNSTSPLLPRIGSLAKYSLNYLKSSKDVSPNDATVLTELTGRFVVIPCSGSILYTFNDIYNFRNSYNFVDVKPGPTNYYEIAANAWSTKGKSGSDIYGLNDVGEDLVSFKNYRTYGAPWLMGDILCSNTIASYNKTSFVTPGGLSTASDIAAEIDTINTGGRYTFGYRGGKLFKNVLIRPDLKTWVANKPLSVTYNTVATEWFVVNTSAIDSTNTLTNEDYVTPKMRDALALETKNYWPIQFKSSVNSDVETGANIYSGPDPRPVEACKPIWTYQKYSRFNTGTEDASLLIGKHNGEINFSKLVSLNAKITDRVNFPRHKPFGFNTNTNISFRSRNHHTINDNVFRQALVDETLTINGTNYTICMPVTKCCSLFDNIELLQNNILTTCFSSINLKFVATNENQIKANFKTTLGYTEKLDAVKNRITGKQKLITQIQADKNKITVSSVLDQTQNITVVANFLAINKNLDRKIPVSLTTSAPSGFGKTTTLFGDSAKGVDGFLTTVFNSFQDNIKLNINCVYNRYWPMDLLPVVEKEFAFNSYQFQLSGTSEISMCNLGHSPGTIQQKSFKALTKAEITALKTNANILTANVDRLKKVVGLIMGTANNPESSRCGTNFTFVNSDNTTCSIIDLAGNENLDFIAKPQTTNMKWANDNFNNSTGSTTVNSSDVEQMITTEFKSKPTDSFFTKTQVDSAVANDNMISDPKVISNLLMFFYEPVLTIYNLFMAKIANKSLKAKTDIKLLTMYASRVYHLSSAMITDSSNSFISPYASAYNSYIPPVADDEANAVNGALIKYVFGQPLEVEPDDPPQTFETVKSIDGLLDKKFILYKDALPEQLYELSAIKAQLTISTDLNKEYEATINSEDFWNTVIIDGDCRKMFKGTIADKKITSKVCEVFDKQLIKSLIKEIATGTFIEKLNKPIFGSVEIEFESKDPMTGNPPTTYYSYHPKHPHCGVVTGGLNANHTYSDFQYMGSNKLSNELTLQFSTERFKVGGAETKPCWKWFMTQNGYLVDNRSMFCMFCAIVIQYTNMVKLNKIGNAPINELMLRSYFDDAVVTAELSKLKYACTKVLEMCFINDLMNYTIDKSFSNPEGTSAEQDLVREKYQPHRSFATCVWNAFKYGCDVVDNVVVSSGDIIDLNERLAGLGVEVDYLGHPTSLFKFTTDKSELFNTTVSGDLKFELTGVKSFGFKVTGLKSTAHYFDAVGKCSGTTLSTTDAFAGDRKEIEYNYQYRYANTITIPQDKFKTIVSEPTFENWSKNSKFLLDQTNLIKITYYIVKNKKDKIKENASQILKLAASSTGIKKA